MTPPANRRVIKKPRFLMRANTYVVLLDPTTDFHDSMSVIGKNCWTLLCCRDWLSLQHSLLSQREYEHRRCK